MKMIVDKAEQALISYIRECLENNMPQRCLHLKFADWDKKEEKPSPAHTTEIVRRTLSDPDGRVYICADGDVFVLSCLMTQKIQSRFLEILLPGCAVFPMTSLFEVTVDGPRMTTICQRKIERIAEKKKKQAAEHDKKTQEAYEEKLSDLKLRPEFVKNISARRKQRQDPEILIVEDDPFTQKLVHGVLRKNYKTTIASEGTEAVYIYARQAPDILFLDIDLPDIVGHDVLQKILEIDPEAYVVMLSGNGDKENVMKAVRNGAKGFVSKPFTKDKLFQYIQKSPHVMAKRQ